MQLPLEIAFHNLPQSDAVEAAVRERAAKLTRFFRSLIACRVVVEVPHRSPQHGPVSYRVRIDMSVPGEDLVVSRDPGSSQEHHDVYVAIRDAFNAAERQLKDRAGRLREQRKPRTAPPHGVVTHLFPHEGYGFLQGPDGQEIYFHHNSVLNEGFEQLHLGDEVRFNPEEGLEGPQASTVELIGRHGKHQHPAPGQ